MKIDCNKQCNYCPIILCEKKGNYIDAGATNKINEGHIHDEAVCVTYK